MGVGIFGFRGSRSSRDIGGLRTRMCVRGGLLRST